MIGWHMQPYVSGLLCLTEPSRLVLAQKAVDCFVQQNWAHRELVVLNATGQALPRLKHPGCDLRTVSLLPKPADALVQLATSLAQGEWCLTWRDDCWFEADYIRAHMLAASKDHQTQVRDVSVYMVDSCRHGPGRVEGLVGFFRLQPARDSVHFIDGRSLVLHFIREHSAHS